MISYIEGILKSKSEPPQIVILTANGLGYELDVPMTTFCNLPEVGAPLSLWTHLAVREDGQFLYGFQHTDERSIFRLLLKVSGIGARTALAILSGLPTNELAQAITQEESARLIKIPGIGKKTAERLILELKDKFPKISGASAKLNNNANAHHQDVINALLALGYQEKEALSAMQQLPAGLAMAESIRLALRFLSKA